MNRSMRQQPACTLRSAPRSKALLLDYADSPIQARAHMRASASRRIGPPRSRECTQDGKVVSPSLLAIERKEQLTSTCGARREAVCLMLRSGAKQHPAARFPLFPSSKEFSFSSKEFSRTLSRMNAGSTPNYSYVSSGGPATFPAGHCPNYSYVSSGGPATFPAGSTTVLFRR